MRTRSLLPRLAAASLPLMVIAACSTYDSATRTIGRDASGSYSVNCHTVQANRTRGGDLRPPVMTDCEQTVWVERAGAKNDVDLATKRAACTARALDCGSVEVTVEVRRDPAGDVAAISIGGATRVLVYGADGVLRPDPCSPSPGKGAKAALAAAPPFTTAARCALRKL